MTRMLVPRRIHGLLACCASPPTVTAPTPRPSSPSSTRRDRRGRHRGLVRTPLPTLPRDLHATTSLTPAALSAPFLCAEGLQDLAGQHQSDDRDIFVEPAPPVCPCSTQSPQGPGMAQQPPPGIMLIDSDQDPVVTMIHRDPTTSCLELQQAGQGLGCHPPWAGQPCAPEADPVLWLCERARGESVGHWIDAVLADERWWGVGCTAEYMRRVVWGL